jgi:hypothetical protein
VQRLPYFPQVRGGRCWASNACEVLPLQWHVHHTHKPNTVVACRQASCDGKLRPALRCRCLPAMQDAATALAPYQLLLLLDARRPVANFGYDGAPSQLVTLPVRQARLVCSCLQSAVAGNCAAALVQFAASCLGSACVGSITHPPTYPHTHTPCCTGTAG